MIDAYAHAGKVFAHADYVAQARKAMASFLAGH